MLYLYVFLLSDARSYWFWICFSRASLILFFIVWRVPWILVFTVLSVGIPYITNVVQLLCSLSGWLQLNCSSIGTGFNGAETNCRIAHNLGILLMNSNCFAIFFSGILVMSVQISIQYQKATTQVNKSFYGCTIIFYALYWLINYKAKRLGFINERYEKFLKKTIEISRGALGSNVWSSPWLAHG